MENTTDPYKIWLSEIILQQTRVDQGLSYFNAFINAFPSVVDLAQSNESEVLKLWQGWGITAGQETYIQQQNLFQGI